MAGLEKNWWPETPFFIRLLSKGFFVAALAFGLALAIAFLLRFVGDREFRDGSARHLVERAEALASPPEGHRFLAPPKTDSEGAPSNRDNAAAPAEQTRIAKRSTGEEHRVQVLPAEGMVLAPARLGEKAGGGDPQMARLWQIAGIVLPPPTHPARALANSALEALLGGEKGRQLCCVDFGDGTLDCLLSVGPNGKPDERAAIWLSDELLRAGLVFPADAAAQTVAREAAQARTGIWWDGLNPNIQVQEQLAWRTLSDATAETSESAAIAASVLRTGYLTTTLSAIFLATTALLVFAKGLRDDELSEERQRGVIDSTTRSIFDLTQPTHEAEIVLPSLEVIVARKRFLNALATQCPEVEWTKLDGYVAMLRENPNNSSVLYTNIRDIVRQVRNSVKLNELDQAPQES